MSFLDSKAKKMQAKQTNSNPYIDEVTANASGYQPMFRKASLNPNLIDSLEDTKAASATENAETDFEREVEDLVDGEAELELEREQKSDDFSSYDPFKDRNRGQDKGSQQERKRKNRRLGKLKRRNAPEATREEVFGFLNGMDEMLNAAQNAVVDDDQTTSSKTQDKDFENWNNWFKSEKKAPPAPDSSKVFYIREEYNTKRSPHLWKSNPNRKWVLAFGENEINNVVSTNLFKYQNETISKDA